MSNAFGLNQCDEHIIQRYVHLVVKYGLTNWRNRLLHTQYGIRLIESDQSNYRMNYFIINPIFEAPRLQINC